MKRAFQVVCVGAIIAVLGSAASADSIQVVLPLNIETVTVDNPGNTADSTGYGGVPDEYKIGKYEVTAGQYCRFLNAVAKTDTYDLYNADMNDSDYGCQITQTGESGSHIYDFSGAPSETTAADWRDRPVNYVSWGDAARFANWIHNGTPGLGSPVPRAQDENSTEDGSYYLNGATSNAALLLVTREDDATWVIPTENEWYKAAYHDKTAGLVATYFDYPTSSDTVPGYVKDDGNLSNDTGTSFADGVTDPGNYATYDGDGGIGDDNGIGPPYFRTEVGEWENSDSPYETFDQGGNVWEWNEAIIDVSYRGLRGGSFYYNDNDLHASTRDNYSPTYEGSSVGFRVSEVPEPATMAILMLGGIGILRRRRKQ